MKEATGEGSLSIITIVVILGLAAAAGIVIIAIVNSASGKAESATTNDVHYCPSGTTYDSTTNTCIKNS